MLVDSTLNLEAIHKEIAENGFSVLRLPGMENLCELARTDYLDALATQQLHPPKQRFHYTELKQAPWRKLAIGSTNGVGEAYAQFLQTIYFDCERSPYPNLNTLFKLVIDIRNRLMGVRRDFGKDPVGDGFWNACRVHHYPSGGGFMVTHTDTYFPFKLGEYSFYQLLIPLSMKGRDFDHGGGVIIDRHGSKINTDDEGGLGTVLVFDGRTRHGVEDVDPEALVDFANPRGRLSVVCNLYVTPPITPP
jgi:hypothetical protein